MSGARAMDYHRKADYTKGVKLTSSQRCLVIHYRLEQYNHVLLLEILIT